MIELDLRDRLREAALTEKDVKEAYVRAQRAVRLLQNPDFVAWRRLIEGDKEKLIRALIKRTESEQDADRKRGKIEAIEQLFAGLELQAGNLEEAARRLESYEQAKARPVSQWEWSLRGHQGR